MRGVLSGNRRYLQEAECAAKGADELRDACIRELREALGLVVKTTDLPDAVSIHELIAKSIEVQANEWEADIRMEIARAGNFGTVLADGVLKPLRSRVRELTSNLPVAISNELNKRTIDLEAAERERAGRVRDFRIALTVAVVTVLAAIGGGIAWLHKEFP